ncbi:four helix bundle protein [Thiohalorhabdus sp.]|uniref:four helix bundle protein n=1 Tax=Thiohalorhabdus sp. TaxID=3094134 RepID=UPI002FC377A7
MGYNACEGLEVWKRTCQLAVRVYKSLEDCKDFGLKNQMTRASVSVASNIAEGAERGSAPDYKRFLSMAKGSAAELRTQLHIGKAVGLVEEAAASKMVAELEEISAMLQGLANSLNQNTLKT